MTAPKKPIPTSGDRRRRALAIVVATCMGATACSSATAPQLSIDAPETTSTTALAVTSENDGDIGSTASSTTVHVGESVDSTFDVSGILLGIETTYTNAIGVWDGFDPRNEPVVLALKDASGRLLGALALNHPSVDALGAATMVRTDGPLGSVALITEPSDASALAELDGFDFHMTLGGVDSFAMVAIDGDSFFDPEAPDYPATLIHEAFHRWQDRGFRGGIGAQDVEGYAYDAENLELAALEDRALAVALAADDDAARRTAATHVAAIRTTRLELDPRVVLDNDQERFEGTARYLEHRTNGDRGHYDDSRYDEELVAIPSDAPGGVKDHYGFGRFYATGAAMMKLLDELGVGDASARVNEGDSPVDVLIDELDIGAADASALTADARSTYDPLGELPPSAEEAAAAASSEGPVFDDDDFTADAGSDGVEITQAEIDCFADLGIDLDDPNVAISEDAFDTCVG